MGRIPPSLPVALVGLGALCGAFWISIPNAALLRPVQPVSGAGGEGRPLARGPVERSLRSGSSDVWWIDLVKIHVDFVILVLMTLFAIVLDRGQVYAKGVFRLGFFLPRLICPASFTLPTSSSNNFLSIRQFLLDQLRQ